MCCCCAWFHFLIVSCMCVTCVIALHCRGQSCRITYTSSKDDMLAAGDLIMCRYVLRTEGFDNAGAVRWKVYWHVTRNMYSSNAPTFSRPLCCVLHRAPSPALLLINVLSIIMLNSHRHCLLSPDSLPSPWLPIFSVLLMQSLCTAWYAAMSL